MAQNVPHTARANIETILRMEEEFTQSRSWSDRIADGIAGFVGTVTFALVHLILFGGWAVINAGLVPSVPPFDPYPFVFLCLIVSLEGVLLSTFVLIKQNRMSTRADQRAHLNLQVDLLAEQEVTKLIQMVAKLSRHLSVDNQVNDPEVIELGTTTAIGDMAEELEARLAATDN